MIGRLLVFTICLLGCVTCMGFLLVHVFTGSPRFLAIATGVSCMGSACFGGTGVVPITWRAARARYRGQRWGCVLCGLLDRVDPGHCDGAPSRFVKSER